MVGVVRYVRASETVVVRVVGRFTVVGIHGGRVMVGVGVVVVVLLLLIQIVMRAVHVSVVIVVIRVGTDIRIGRVIVVVTVGSRFILHVPADDSKNNVASEASTRQRVNRKASRKNLLLRMHRSSVQGFLGCHDRSPDKTGGIIQQ